MPPDPNTQNGYCKGHTGLMEAVDHIKRTQQTRDDTVTRLWTAIEGRVGTRVFLSILTVSITIFGLIIGVLFYNQDHILSALVRSQENITEKMSDLKVDVEIIKQQLRLQNDDRRKECDK